jgi:hypothetical protein
VTQPAQGRRSGAGRSDREHDQTSTARRPTDDELPSPWEGVPLSAGSDDLAAVRAEDDEPTPHPERPAQLAHVDLPKLGLAERADRYDIVTADGNTRRSASWSGHGSLPTVGLGPTPSSRTPHGRNRAVGQCIRRPEPRQMTTSPVTVQVP